MNCLFRSYTFISVYGLLAAQVKLLLKLPLHFGAGNLEAALFVELDVVLTAVEDRFPASHVLGHGV